MKPSAGDYQAEALDFLRQSLRDYDGKMWKFAVLHASMAIEMLLKERLVKINPGTVLEKIDEPGCKTTVGMSRIIPRLESLGITLSKSDQELIRLVADWRNDVAHRRLVAHKTDVAKKLSALYKFFSRFLLNELETEINKALDPSDYTEFRDLLKGWDDIEIEAQGEAKAAGRTDGHATSITYNCPQCWGVTDTVALVGEKAHCFLCREDFDHMNCSRCGEDIIGDSGNENADWCDMCSGRESDLE